MRSANTSTARGDALQRIHARSNARSSLPCSPRPRNASRVELSTDGLAWRSARTTRSPVVISSGRTDDGSVGSAWTAAFRWNNNEPRSEELMVPSSASDKRESDSSAATGSLATCLRSLSPAVSGASRSGSGEGSLCDACGRFGAVAGGTTRRGAGSTGAREDDPPKCPSLSGTASAAAVEYRRAGSSRSCAWRLDSAGSAWQNEGWAAATRRGTRRAPCLDVAAVSMLVGTARRGGVSARAGSVRGVPGPPRCECSDSQLGRGLARRVGCAARPVGYLLARWSRAIQGV